MSLRNWNRRIATRSALAHCGLWRPDEPDASLTGGTGPQFVQRPDPLQRGVNFGCCRFSLACVGLYVEGCLNVGFQIRKKRVQILQHLFGVLIEPPTKPGKEFPDLPPIVRCTTAEG